MTVTDAELAWVTTALDVVFPDVHGHERTVVTQDTSLDCRRTRLYGVGLTDFVQTWGLRARGTEMVVPPQLFTAPLPVVAAYLRSLFQAEGYLSARETSTLVGLDMIGEELIRGVQGLLARFGIFARVSRKVEKREDRHDLWCIRIQNAGDRRAFADEIGFVDPVKARSSSAPSTCPGAPPAPSSAWRSPAWSRAAPWRSMTSRPSPASTCRRTCGCTTASSSRSTTRWTPSSTGTRRRGRSSRAAPAPA
jgi:hypothetical protein